MKQTMAIVAIFLIALGFVFIVIGYAEREGPITLNGNGNDDDSYPPEITPDDETPPETPPEGDDGGLPDYGDFPPWEYPPPERPQSTFNIFGYTVSIFELLGIIMCIFGAVLFVTGGKL